MTAYQAYNSTNSEEPVIKAAQALISLSDVQSFLSTEWTGGALDQAMVTCAILTEATPLGLAQYAVAGQAEQNIVADLLNDTLLMRDMLVAGGARSGQYGQAMQILGEIYNASTVLPNIPRPPPGGLWDDRNQTTMLHRLALGTALGNAVPIEYRYQWSPNQTAVDPVERYLFYEKHYLEGKLDPALEVLTSFECSWTTNCRAPNVDLEWILFTMGTYRPDHIATDYTWRYARAVRTDVAYGDPACERMPGICTGHFYQIPAAGGVCGPRAFFGRYTRKAFGVPTFGVTQPGHAAMSTWTPSGWEILLGADWEYSWWDTVNRGGPDFYLETQCRELRPEYQKVLRGQWAALARKEQPVNPSWTPRDPKSYGQGGPWSALMLYAKKIAVNATTPPPRPIGPSVVPTKVEAFNQQWQEPLPPLNISVDSNGTIVIPGPAFAYKNSSASIQPMWSYDEGQQLMHNEGNYADPSATSFGYELEMENAETRYLTVNHTTWHMNTDLLLETNTTKGPVNVPVYFTVGYWNQTQPIEVDLVKGKNFLKFSRSTPAEIVIKDFFLYSYKPDIPPPNPNHTTKPIPPPNDYIEVSPMTTCVKQGILDVPEQFCQNACEAVGLKFTGNKPRTNMTGCFGLSDGEWAGNCGYNTNSSGVICSDPPCKVFGSTAQQVCLRQ